MRVWRIEGQLRGLQWMLAEGRDCGEIVQQMAAARAALDRVAMDLVAAGLEQCVRMKLRRWCAALARMTRRLWRCENGWSGSSDHRVVLSKRRRPKYRIVLLFFPWKASAWIRATFKGRWLRGYVIMLHKAASISSRICVAVCSKEAGSLYREAM